MNMKKKSDENNKIRITVSLPLRQKKELVRLAGAKKVSIAWVIREAIDQYLYEDTPLFYKKG